MPPANRFRHQVYTDAAPNAPYYLVRAESGPEVGSPEFLRRMRAAGDLFRAAGVEAVYLVHGTFVGNDAAGVCAALSQVMPAAGNAFRELSKAWIDTVLDELGNYTSRFGRLFEQAINGADRSRIPVRLFHWSSENHHVARADAAVRLLAELDGLPNSGRVLLWGHSHAGNVFALLTNLLGSDRSAVDAFFHAARPFYRSPWTQRLDLPVWDNVWKRLTREPRPLAETRLDIVTFGTPIRYGWDTDGYAGLLHFVNHRPVVGLPDHRAPFPPSWDEVLQAALGDSIQQVGIAGTNVAPSMFSWRRLSAERRLNLLLQPQLPARQLYDRLRLGMRVPQEGTTLLVNYGPPQGTVAKHHAGHAVYTLPQWLLFHTEQAAAHFYGPAEIDSA